MWLLQHTSNVYWFGWVTVHLVSNAIQIWYNVSGCTALYFLVQIIIMVWVDTMQDIQSRWSLLAPQSTFVSLILISKMLNPTGQRHSEFITVMLHSLYDFCLNSWLGKSYLWCSVMQIAKWINVSLPLSHLLNHEIMGVVSFIVKLVHSIALSRCYNMPSLRVLK